MNIFGITGQYLELLQMAEDEALDQDMINDTLEGVDWEFEEKADAYAKVMNSLEGNVAAIDIPKEYYIPQDPKLDKTAIKKFLKDNEVSWAHLQQGESLRIR